MKGERKQQKAKSPTRRGHLCVACFSHIYLPVLGWKYWGHKISAADVVRLKFHDIDPLDNLYDSS